MNLFYKIALLLISSSVFSQIDRIEPPFWWSDMQQTDLQLMVHGEKISEYKFEMPDVIVKGILKTENPNYQFITLSTENLSPGRYPITFSQNGKIVHSQVYEIKQRKEGSRLRKGFDSSDVIYLIMPDRFANGDPNNDSTTETIEKVNRTLSGGRHGGDIKGIIDHLDYISELGPTAVWSTPLLEDNEPAFSYHQYAISDHYKIDPRYGTNADYRKLSTELHNRDMKLIMDYVTNHWGSEHWMIKDLPSKEFIHYWEGGPKGFQRSSYRMATQFDSNASIEDSKACMNGWFDVTMPDMNQRNPILLQYMIQNAIWWIEYADLDGLRVDTYSYNDKDGIARWTKAIMDEYPNFNIVGEVWMHDQAHLAYWQKDSRIGAMDSYNSYLPSVMDFTLYEALTTMYKENKGGWNNGMIKAYDNFVNDFLYPDIDNILVFAGNHDTNRINEVYGNDLASYKLVLTLLSTVRGIPQLYYGDEIAMAGNKDKKGDGDVRKDFPGGWPNDSKNAFSASGRTQIQNDFFNFTKRLLNWRKDKDVVHKGKTVQFVPQDNVYVFFRYNDQDTIMVVINNGDVPKQITLERFSEMIDKKQNGRDVISGNNIALGKSLEIPGRSSMIIELE